MHAVAFSPVGNYIWHDGYLSTGVVRSTLNGHSGFVNAVAFSPDGKLVASGSLGKTVTLVPAHYSARHSERVMAVAFSPDGELLPVGVFIS